MFFVDRQDAGEQVAVRVVDLRGADVVVVGLPRGGVPVAAAVARVLGAPLDVCLVRKLGVPVQPEVAMGALGEDGVRIVDDRTVLEARVTEDEFAEVERRERAALDRMAHRYRPPGRHVEVKGRTVIVVDDGVATGASARAACAVLRARGAARVVLAVPVAPRRRVEGLRRIADELVCVYTPRDLLSVGRCYAHFPSVTDQEVLDCLERADARLCEPAVASAAGLRRFEAEGRRVDETRVEVSAGDVRLAGRLCLPRRAAGIVVFAHGSGSSRHSVRNRFVAAELNCAGLGTLLFDLLTEQEGEQRDNVFDIERLGLRLAAGTDWLRARPGYGRLPIGYFGASTGAAAALKAAARPDAGIAAVVSRGGRVDLAGPALAEVTAPTLLIVGSRDQAVLDLNRRAQARLHCENRLEIVPGATHLFEEPRALTAVAALARQWFTEHMPAAAAHEASR